MIRFASEQDLLETFRSLDQSEVQLPAGMAFPLLMRDYLAWVEPSGHRTFLIFEDQKSKTPVGVVFRRTQETGEPVAKMCQWCHSVRGGSAVGMLTAKASRNRFVGVTVCRDLSCKEKALELPGVNDLRESLDGQQKLMRILSSMSDFARRNLF